MKNKHHQYTEEQLRFLELEAAMPRRELTAAFNARFGTDVSVSAIKGACKRHGFMTGRTGCFAAGHQTWNAGMKGWQAGGRSAETRFGKDHKPHNWQPIGHERLTKEGYLQRKVTDTGDTVNDYVEVHRLLWEEHHGPIPDGHIVTFRDGDRTHIALDNLMLMTRAESAVINLLGLGRVDAELKPAARTLAQLKLQTNERARKTARKRSQAHVSGANA